MPAATSGCRTMDASRAPDPEGLRFGETPIVEKIRRHAPAPDRTPGEIRGQAAVARFDRDRFDDQPANGPPGVLVAANDERSERDREPQLEWRSGQLDGLERERIPGIPGDPNHQPPPWIVGDRSRTIFPGGKRRQREERRDLTGGRAAAHAPRELNPETTGHPERQPGAD